MPKILNQSPDVGQQLSERIRGWANIRDVGLICGRVQPARTPVVDLELDDDADVAAQLIAIFERNNPELIVIGTDLLAADDIEDTLGRLRSTGADDAAVAATDICREFVDQVAFLDVCALIKEPLLFLRYRFVATWYRDAYRDDVSEVDDRIIRHQDPEEMARYEAEREEQEKWTPAARSKAAREIASDPRFPRAKTEAARVLITRGVLGADTPNNEYLTKEISREAKAVFDLELKPSK